MAMRICHVIIVTNAAQGWVELTCAAFLDAVLPSLQNISIVSARSTYEQSSADPEVWKRLAFENEMESFYGSTSESQERNIISVGDSLFEQQALVSVTQSLSHCRGKSVKFMDTPSIQQLIDQHQFLSECFLDILEHDGDLDVEMSEKGFC